MEATLWPVHVFIRVFFSTNVEIRFWTRGHKCHVPFLDTFAPGGQIKIFALGVTINHMQLWMQIAACGLWSGHNTQPHIINIESWIFSSDHDYKLAAKPASSSTYAFWINIIFSHSLAAYYHDFICKQYGKLWEIYLYL